MECNYCEGVCAKAGKQPNGRQKYQCKGCGKHQQAEYRYKACGPGINATVVAHVKEGCGIWNTARLMGIAKGTVIARIKRIAKGIKPVDGFPDGCSYEVDELHTFVGSKQNECYVSYALCRETI